MKHNFFKSLFFISFIFISCSGSSDLLPPETTGSGKILEIKGADFSFLPEVRQSGLLFYNQNGIAEDMLSTFKNSGGNVVRLRIWVNPNTATSNFATVKSLSQEIKNRGMKVMISVHYSDSWADPSQQTKPSIWQNHTFAELKNDVYLYTKQIMTEIHPEYIQIGNEINNGFLWPEGNFSNLLQFKQLLQSGISAVRDSNSSTKIIIHFAGIDGANNFFSQISDVDYDIIGISYYPIWHGKDLNVLQQNFSSISNLFNKPILVAETAYPFTLDWNDATNNIIGLSNQILPNFSATKQGQKDYLNRMKIIMKEVPKGIGFCYWGAEWTSYKGANATDGSSWENQAFWDFNNYANPVLEIYKD